MHVRAALEQPVGGLVLAPQHGLGRHDVLVHEGAIAGAELLEPDGGASSVTATRLASHAVRLGFYMGYAPPGTNPLELIDLAKEAEQLGYTSAWAAEAWGTDAVSVLAWLGAQTERIKLGSAILQLPARSPANTAMTAVTLDLLSGGRLLLGLGTSGPQVVEGWHGEPGASR